MKNNDTQNFKIQKIKGDFAELICKHHFELMGYTVDKVGIEQLSPSFAKLNDSHSWVKNIKEHIQKLPDFLAVCPQKELASFIEVKFRDSVTANEELKIVQKIVP